ncbi:hypothetical protein DPEC_G00169580 [Dallia pectoralis]|uniref:Uncharacterized protein n=1 Tax=Dallia pectoralis TaxID=75939 RepID=A0ACC2GD48_DALPE|nr:hypothetical protein DPEC_G00169580 [Dallia pectoralis]
MNSYERHRFSANSFSGFGGWTSQRRQAMCSSFGTAAGVGGSGLGFGEGCSAGARNMFGRGGRGGGDAGRGCGDAGRGGGDLSLGVAGNDREQMTNLNSRLATYLEKVRELEETNCALEEKLRTFTCNKLEPHDLTMYDKTLIPLKEQLMKTLMKNTHMAIEIDNARLAADDFKLKWENELAMRQCVEGDVGGLKHLHSQYEMDNKVLKKDLQGYEEERLSMRKNHEEDLLSMRGGMSGQVNVDIQSAKGQNLSLVLAGIRSEYETTMEKNRKQAEDWYSKQVERKQEATVTATTVTTPPTSELTDLRKRHQTLQIECDGLRMGIVNLEARLVGIQSQFQQSLSGYSVTVKALEEQLTSIRFSITEQSDDYRALLNIKSRLEKEIHQYRGLLEGVHLGEATEPLGKVVVTIKTIMSEVMSSGGGAAGQAVMSSGGGKVAGEAVMPSGSVSLTSSSSSSGRGADTISLRVGPVVSSGGGALEVGKKMSINSFNSENPKTSPVVISAGGVVEGGIATSGTTDVNTSSKSSGGGGTANEGGMVITEVSSNKSGEAIISSIITGSTVSGSGMKMTSSGGGPMQSSPSSTYDSRLMSSLIPVPAVDIPTVLN